jgi:hypothetical protein
MGMAMPGVDTAMNTLTVPIWAAGAASAVLVVALMAAFGKLGTATMVAAFFRVAVVVIAVAAGYLYLERSAVQNRLDARRSLDERSAALMARAIAPGSALSCLDELAGETVEAACERAVFASPEGVAAAVSYVTAQLALLADGTRYAQQSDANYAGELSSLRTALELDRFGIVAHVLLEREGCTVDRCDALSRFADTSRVLANLRDNPFEALVTKYTASWTASASEGPAVAAVTPVASAPAGAGSVPVDPATYPAAIPAAPPPLAAAPTPAPASVSPRYDFPSSKSIPPVSIMAPEPPAPRASDTLSAPDSTAQVATTPVPPRRPPQTRAAAPRPASARQEPPALPADPPVDAAAPPRPPAALPPAR